MAPSCLRGFRSFFLPANSVDGAKTFSLSNSLKFTLPFCFVSKASLFIRSPDHTMALRPLGHHAVPFLPPFGSVDLFSLFQSICCTYVSFAKLKLKSVFSEGIRSQTRRRHEAAIAGGATWRSRPRQRRQLVSHQNKSMEKKFPNGLFCYPTGSCLCKTVIFLSQHFHCKMLQERWRNTSSGQFFTQHVATPGH